MGNLSPEEKAKVEKDVREEFDKIDTDKSGKIERNELKAILEKMSKKMGGHPVKDEELDDIFKGFDKDNDGKITFDEIMQEWVSFAILVGLSE